MATPNDFHHSTSTIGASCTPEIHCKHGDGSTTIRLMPNNPEYNKLDNFYLIGTSAEIRDLGFALLALGAEIKLSELDLTVPEYDLTIPDAHLDDVGD